MKFIVQRDALFNSLQKVQSVVEKKNTIPILANILCTLKANELSISATDLDVGIRLNIEVQGIIDGKLTLSAKNLLDIVKELPSKEITLIKKENHWIEIICGKSKFNIVSLSAEDYPTLPVFEEKIYIDAKISALKEMIDCTAFAASTDTTRYNLIGVYLEPLENNLMRMTATDGHRLSFYDQEIFLKNPELKRGIIIPKKGLLELRRFLDTPSSVISLAFEKGILFAKLDNSFIFIRLIDGEYPDYRQVIPKVTDKILKLKHEVFYSALKRVSLLAHEKSRGVKFTIQTGLLVISSSNPDLGEAREEIDVDYEGESIEVGFNSKYILDCLSIIQTDDLELQLKDRLNPGVLQTTERRNHTYVLMPMRI